MEPIDKWLAHRPFAADDRLVERLTSFFRWLTSIFRALLGMGRPRSSHPTDCTVFGGEHLPVGNEKLHFAYCGSTGSGKSTLLQLLMQFALSSIGSGLGRRAIVYDAKLDLLSTLAAICPASKLFLLNPFDKRTAKWDLSADIEDPTSARQVAAIFIPENDALAQPFFEATARDILAGVILSLIVLKRTKGVHWDLRDVILGCSPRYVEQVLEICPQNRSLIDTQIRGRPETTKDVYSTLSVKLAPFRAIAALWSKAEGVISLRDWVQSESVIVLGSNPAKSEAMDAINRVVFNRLVELFSDAEDCRHHQVDPRRNWIFLDELPQLGKLDKLKKLLPFGRTKGVCVVLGFQDIESLYTIYSKDAAHALLGSVNYKAFLRLESDVTSAWASELIGKTRVLMSTQSSSQGYGAGGASGSLGTGQSFHEISEVMSSEIMGLPEANSANGIEGYFLMPGKFKHYRINPFTSGELVPPAENVANFEKADSINEYLQDWDEQDLIRLGLHEADAPKPSKRPRRAVIERQSHVGEGRLPTD